jgi:hypothetical protein
MPRPRTRRTVGLAFGAIGLAIALWPQPAHAPAGPPYPSYRPGRHFRAGDLVRLGGFILFAFGFGMVVQERSEWPLTVLDARGLRDRHGRIRWRDVRGLQLTPRPSLLLEIPRARYRERCHPHDDGYGAGETIQWSVDLSVMNVSAEELNARLQEWRLPIVPAHRSHG